MSDKSPRSRDKGSNVDEDLWFSGELKTGKRARAQTDASPRDQRIVLGLGVWCAVVLLLGLILGAFSGSSPAAASANAEKELRGLAKAQAGTHALETLPLDAHLDRLAQLGEQAGAVAPTPAPADPAAAAPATPVDDKGGKVEAPKTEIKKDATRTGDNAAAKAETVAAAPKAGADTTAKPAPAERVDPMKMKIDAVPATPGVPADPKAEAKAAEAKAAEAKAAAAKAADAKAADAKGDAGSLDEQLTAAKGLLDGGRWAEAKAAYDRVLAKQPASVKALYGRGSALYQLHQTGAALADMEAVLAIDAKHPSALLLAGAISQASGKTDAARKYYSRYVEAWPSGRKASEIRAILERL